jgi:hypothetical protein
MMVCRAASRRLATVRAVVLVTMVAAALAASACVRTYTTTVREDATVAGAQQHPVRSATNLPRAFIVVTAAATPGNCPPRLRDPELRTALTLRHSIMLPTRDSTGATGYSAYGDYSVEPPGLYGDEPGDGLRVDCARLSALGVVRLDGGS